MNKRWRFFKVGDIVINEYVCGKRKKFVIDTMYGNDYCPLIETHAILEEKKVKNTFIFVASMVKLVNAQQRPLRRLKKEALLRMNKKGVVEAKREIMIRLYNDKKL